jgi:hypothetical protein
LTTSKTKQFCQTSSCFEVDNIKNAAILRDFLNFRIWQHQKRSNSARLPSKKETWVQSWRPRANSFFDWDLADKTWDATNKTRDMSGRFSQTSMDILIRLGGPGKLARPYWCPVYIRDFS